MCPWEETYGHSLVQFLESEMQRNDKLSDGFENLRTEMICVLSKVEQRMLTVFLMHSQCWEIRNISVMCLVCQAKR